METLILAILMNMTAPTSAPKIDVPGTEMKIYKGMTKKQVVEAIGAPTVVYNDRFVYKFNYDLCNDTGCNVSFDSFGRATSTTLKAKYVSSDFYE